MTERLACVMVWHLGPRPVRELWQGSVRLRAHVHFACLVWPLLTILASAVALTRLPYYYVSPGRALAFASAGIGLSAPDLLLAGAVFFGLSGALFARYGHTFATGGGHWRAYLEPPLLLLVVLLGATLWYPAVLAESGWGFVPWLPVVSYLVILAGAVAIGVCGLGRTGQRRKLAIALSLVGCLAPVPLHVRAALEGGRQPTPEVLLLGLDSLSLVDPVSDLRTWIERRDGTWYERAVAPSLFTNAVWASILMAEPVRSHGVFHTFQRLPVEQAPLVTAARERGYHTVGFFPDQLSSFPGADAGFDDDRSGPVGWRQILLPIVANGSLLVPLVRPVLPHGWWPSGLSANQAGTYTYDLRRDLRAILRTGHQTRPTVVAAHLTYMHSPVYPRSLDLGPREWVRIAGANVGAVRDRSLDWQHSDRPSDPVALREWKLRHLQSLVRTEVDRSGFFDNGGRLILFSDHGDRHGVTYDTFMDDRYHQVLLATVGFEADCPARPISLVDVGYLAGLTSTRAAPAVEFALAPPEIWPRMVETARLAWSGRVTLDESVLGQVFGDLRRFDPDPEPCAPTRQGRRE